MARRVPFRCNSGRLPVVRTSAEKQTIADSQIHPTWGLVAIETHQNVHASLVADFFGKMWLPRDLGHNWPEGGMNLRTTKPPLSIRPRLRQMKEITCGPHCRCPATISSRDQIENMCGEKSWT